MERIIGNFTSQPNMDFPLDCETLEMLQSNASLLALLGNVIGDKVILQGCVEGNDGATRGAGWVYLKTRDYPDGEILPWEGGSVASGMYVKTENIKVSAFGNEYPQAYIKRSLAEGIGTECYAWEDFSELVTIPDLKTELNSLKQEVENFSPMPLGVVQMWAGITVPDGYALCDGRELSAKEYQALFNTIGTTFNKTEDYNGVAQTTTAGYFRLPDLRGRFVVGQNGDDNDYKMLGMPGGEKTHTLQAHEMPAHSHQVDIHGKQTGAASSNYGTFYCSEGNSTNNLMTKTTGGGKAHENRPPYYVLAYIMRIK